jgi:hypothetical protein
LARPPLVYLYVTVRVAVSVVCVDVVASGKGVFSVSACTPQVLFFESNTFFAVFLIFLILGPVFPESPCFYTENVDNFSEPAQILPHFQPQNRQNL